MAALVTRFCFETCFTCGMVASSISLDVASVRSAGPARKGCRAINAKQRIEFLFIFVNKIDA